jgi:hypothetical protein
MGWKNVKEHYRIGHIVQVTPKGIAIGSGYISEIILISSEGRILKRDEGRCNEDIARYQKEMDADPETLRRLVLTPDTFESSITVFTYEDGAILEKKCEVLGLPNVTHDGLLMYNNYFSPDKTTVVKWAKRNANAGVKYAKEHLADAEDNLLKRRERLKVEEAHRAKLEADYPEVVVSAQPDAPDDIKASDVAATEA